MVFVTLFRLDDDVTIVNNFWQI